MIKCFMSNIAIRVQPNSRREGILFSEDGILRVKVLASPINGKANFAVVSLLAKVVGVKRGRIRLIKGQRSKDKVFGIEGLSQKNAELLIRNAVVSCA